MPNWNLDRLLHSGAMTTLVNLDGVIVPPEAAKVSVFDRGFLYGDSVYESLRTYSRVPFLLDRHLLRLERSAGRLELSIRGGIERVAREVHATIAALPHQESTLRIVVTRGAREGVVDLDPNSAGDGMMVILAREAKPYPAELYETGVDISVVSVVRNRRDMVDPAVKSGNYLNNMLAIQEARRRSAFESVMKNSEGFLTECSTSNLFIVSRGELRTPALDCGLLDGVTRGLLLEIAIESGIRVREERLTERDLHDADEVFLSSSLKEVMPVARVDGSTVGLGRPGPITLRLLAALRERIAREIGSPYSEARSAR